MLRQMAIRHIGETDDMTIIRETLMFTLVITTIVLCAIMLMADAAMLGLALA